MPSLSALLCLGCSVGAINKTDEYCFKVGAVRLHAYDRPIVRYAEIEYRLSDVDTLLALEDIREGIKISFTRGILIHYILCNGIIVAIEHN